MPVPPRRNSMEHRPPRCSRRAGGLSLVIRPPPARARDGDADDAQRIAYRLTTVIRPACIAAAATLRVSAQDSAPTPDAARGFQIT
jgi:hypothetical protein